MFNNRNFRPLMVALFFLCALNVQAQSIGQEARQALFSTFHRPPDWPISIWNKKGMRHIQVCDDSCALVYWKPDDRQGEDFAWIALFLYEYFFNSAEIGKSFRSQNNGVAEKISKKYVEFCPEVKEERKQAQCIMSRLSDEHSMTMAAVRYDEDYRCVAPFTPLDMSAKKGARCFKLRDPR